MPILTQIRRIRLRPGGESVAEDRKKRVEGHLHPLFSNELASTPGSTQLDWGNRLCTIADRFQAPKS